MIWSTILAGLVLSHGSHRGFCSLGVQSVGGCHWNYTLQGDDWKTICNGQYPYCGGERQSPLNLTNLTPLNPVSSPKRTAQWRLSSQLSGSVQNNGHSLQMTATAGDSNLPVFVWGEELFSLNQFHYHLPPEHILPSSPQMEFHFVHRNPESGFYSVVAIFFRSSDKSSPLLKQIIPFINATAPRNLSLDVSHFLSRVRDSVFWFYSGSLTTPPCSEIVNWFIFPEVLDATADELLAFDIWKVGGASGNFRRTQPENERKLWLVSPIIGDYLHPVSVAVLSTCLLISMVLNVAFAVFVVCVVIFRTSSKTPPPPDPINTRYSLI